MNLPDADLLPFPAFIADAGGIIRTVNAAWRRQLPDGIGQRWPDDFTQTRAAEPVGIPAIGADHARLRIRTANLAGTTCWFEVHSQPLPDAEDDPAQTFGILVDVTAQTRREAEILTILHTAVDAIIIIDEAGRIETFNEAAERLFGWREPEIRGEPVDLLMAEPHRSRHAGYLTRYLRTGEARIIGIGRELEAVTRDGKRVPIHLSVSEISLAGQRRFTGFIRDLSEQMATREMLSEQREKLAHVGRLSTMGEMTASIAHEINQPLTAIAMYAQSGLKLLQRDEPDRDKLAAALEKLNTQSLRAGAIIERIQRFARAQESQRELIDINGLLKDLIKLTEGDARLHDMELDFKLAEGLPPLLADPVQIQQVALNLIRNAIDAMNEIRRCHGRTIRIISQALADGRVEVAVTDQGPGVAEDQTKLLFTPFHTTKKDGMGMGLSICRTIIAEHGGVLGFRDNGPAPGATFFFTLQAERPGETASHA